MRFSGKVAIVTGAGSGIGKATALLLAKEGARVVVDDIIEERVKTVVAEIEAQGGQAIGVLADVGKQRDVDRLVATAVSTYGRVDILVNNAAVLYFGGLLDTPEEDWDRMLDTNLRGVYRCSRRVVPEMMKVGKGKIVNVGSIGENQAYPRIVAYCATKGALAALTRGMALDLIRHHIYVNAVSPSRTRANLNPDRPADTVLVHQPYAGIPIGYGAEPEDQAKVILFLASEESDYMVGQSLTVDGGRTVAIFPLTSPWVSQ